MTDVPTSSNMQRVSRGLSTASAALGKNMMTNHLQLTGATVHIGQNTRRARSAKKMWDIGLVRFSWQFGTISQHLNIKKQIMCPHYNFCCWAVVRLPCKLFWSKILPHIAKVKIFETLATNCRKLREKEKKKTKWREHRKWRVRVAKCQIFYTEQIFQTKFYPKKSTQIATNLALGWNKINTKSYFWGTKAEHSII